MGRESVIHRLPELAFGCLSCLFVVLRFAVSRSKVPAHAGSHMFVWGLCFELDGRGSQRALLRLNLFVSIAHFGLQDPFAINPVALTDFCEYSDRRIV